MTMDSILPVGADAADGQPGKRKYTKSEHYKQRRRHDRFNGMTEEEVRSRTLPDHLASNLDVVIVRVAILISNGFLYPWALAEKSQLIVCISPHFH